MSSGRLLTTHRSCITTSRSAEPRRTFIGHEVSALANSNDAEQSAARLAAPTTKDADMFRIIGSKAKDLCDAHLRPSRRDLLRVGGAGMLGLSLGSLLKLQSVQAAGAATPIASGGPGWGKAKSIIMVYLQ